MDLKPKLKAIAAFRERGIEVKMITGDAKETAVAISAQLAMGQKRAVSGTSFFNVSTFELDPKNKDTKWRH